MVIVTAANFGEDEISFMDSLSPLDMLAAVAVKMSEKERSCSKPSSTKMMIMPMTEKKRLPFDLNLKPRTHGRPRSTPIDVHALLPGLSQKRKRQQQDIHNNRCGDSSEGQPQKKMRLIVRFRLPPQQLEPELPLEYKDKIGELGGSDPKLVIKKKLFDSDVDKGKSRLMMPYKQCKFDFGDIGETKVKVIHPGYNNNKELREIVMNLKKWDKVSSYVFNTNWNALVDATGLEAGNWVHVWSFKQQDQLAFALVILR